jgi:HAD superfamily hydrolase (TIGR01509 family)
VDEASVTAGGLKAIVFDIDGTLYRTRPLRARMMIRLARFFASDPKAATETMKILRAYRRAQEELRRSPEAIPQEQLDLACTRVSVSRERVVECVTRWMHREPLPLLRRCITPGIVELLTACRAAGVRVAALSDYPDAGKLDALGISAFFDHVVCAQDEDVRAFKPHPRGLSCVLQRLGVSPAEALYVGDRVDVDAAVAAACGVPCVILGARDAGRDYRCAATVSDLRAQIRL